MTNAKTMCFRDNILYNYNRKRGMYEFNIPEKKLFCVNFDDASIMSQFYPVVQSLSKDTLISYINTLSNSSYSQILSNNTFYVIPTPIYFYKWGDIITVYNITKSSYYDLFFFVKQPGPYGECVKNKIIRFWNNVPTISCRNFIVI